MHFPEYFGKLLKFLKNNMINLTAHSIKFKCNAFLQFKDVTLYQKPAYQKKRFINNLLLLKKSFLIYFPNTKKLIKNTI